MLAVKGEQDFQDVGLTVKKAVILFLHEVVRRHRGVRGCIASSHGCGKADRSIKRILPQFWALASHLPTPHIMPHYASGKLRYAVGQSQLEVPDGVYVNRDISDVVTTAMSLGRHQFI